ncbi:hypothetical protein [Streptomyces yaizuensis]|uniref:Uncharacterized protein n=1 Tax=Streptomyces yaizuensis TaxID=2989713 RepID=A0ABQ5P663_9ACTN|nr:hypothetical protein [Streptomyces sp. YSPA8]GLF98047.1 hypothetical protein SYYSPA8_27140 [Streptomyces sp. YSPA8]
MPADDQSPGRVRAPARTLRDTLQGDAHEWMNFPRVELLPLVEQARDLLGVTTASARAPLPGGFAGRLSAHQEGDEAVAALRRAHERLSGAVTALLALSRPLRAAAMAVEAALSELADRSPGRSAAHCWATAT